MDGHGKARFQWIVELTQRVPEYLDWNERNSGRGSERTQPDYYFRGGCTLIIDAESGELLYSIKKDLTPRRRQLQRRYMEQLMNSHVAGLVREKHTEPFAVLHRSELDSASSETSLDSADMVNQPFNAWFRISEADAKRDPFFQKHYGFDDPSKRWRQIESVK